MYCAECVMRRRIAAIEATGKEPTLTAGSESEQLGFDTTLYGPLREALTVVQGTALCEVHIVECLKIQHVSPLAAPNGGQIIRAVG